MPRLKSVKIGVPKKTSTEICEKIEDRIYDQGWFPGRVAIIFCDSKKNVFEILSCDDCDLKASAKDAITDLQ